MPAELETMTLARRSGAPRLIEWTGERCVPWAPDVQVVYEHLHRYMWAERLVQGRRVLDLASGEGFGASILATSAEFVAGIDVDEQTVNHSSLNYGCGKISFQVGDARDLSRFPDGSFDAVVAFEMIEHVVDQAHVLEEITRVLAPDGLLIMSTPDRRAYSTAHESHNPFHLQELDFGQFQDLLGRYFGHTAIWGQRTITGSALSLLAAHDDVPDAPGTSGRTFFIKRSGDEFLSAGGMSALYLVAIATNGTLPRVESDSTLADCDVTLLRAAERQGVDLASELERREREHAATAAAGRQEADRELRNLQRVVDDREVELSLRSRRMSEMLAQLDHDQGTIETLQADLSTAQLATREMHESVTWRAFRRGRDRFFGLIGGKGSQPARAVQAAVRGVGRLAQGTSSQTAGVDRSLASIELPEFEDPRVSLVIPLYAGAELTRSCLESIRDHTSRASYEVIIVNDGNDPATATLLKEVHGARIIVNETNLGFLRSVNRGAVAGRGDWIVLCNNDIEVRDGWLEAMLDCGESAPDIGVVTPKYLYPDLSLNEAGGVIWRDGTGVNYGRGGSPGEFRFEFRREVDYGSAAALMVRTEFWRDVGGFDERFAPMYYEDTDICFQARERGLRVVYEPRANVIHLEGGTAGTDVESGHKRFQEINRAKFVDKWAAQLEAEHLGPGVHNVRQGSDRARGPRVLILDHRVPMWDRDSGSLRMKGIIEALRALGCRITLFPDDRHLVIPYTLELQRLGVEVWFGELDIAAELSAIGPELAMVLACRPHTTSRWLDLIRDRAPTAAIVYDTVDLHWLRLARQASDDPIPPVSRGTPAAALREIELALIRACDATLVVSRDERGIVETDVPGTPIWVAPNVNAVRRPVAGAEPREGVLFVGGFEHTPNIQAVVRLARDVMPIVWGRLGRVPVTIVGGSVPQEVRELASGQVDIAGWVPGIDPMLDRARAMVAPLSYGAGLKGKVTQSLAAGLPVVTTSIGAEGLDATDGQQLLIADDDAGLAERVIRLLTEDELWKSVSKTGQQLAESLCSPRVMLQVMSEILEASPSLRAGELRPSHIS